MSNASSSQTSPKLPVVPWNPWLGLAFIIFVYFVSQFISGIAIGLYPILQGWSEAEAVQWATDYSITINFVFFVITEVSAIGAVYLWLKQFELGFSSIGLRRPRWSDVGYGILAVPVYFLFYGLTLAIVTQLVPSLDIDQKQQLGFDNVFGAYEMTLTFISLVILPPLAEEIMVRGFLYGTLKKALPIISAAIMTSLLFAVAHLSGGGSAGPIYIAAVDTFVLSLVLIYLREKTNGLWAPMTLHAIKNGIAFSLLFVFRAA